jgi:hypothetical protein
MDNSLSQPGFSKTSAPSGGGFFIPSPHALTRQPGPPPSVTPGGDPGSIS